MYSCVVLYKVPIFYFVSVNLNVARGKLIAVVGHVGSGKSSLLSALLGEMIKTDGSVAMNVSNCNNNLNLCFLLSLNSIGQISHVLTIML